MIAFFIAGFRSAGPETASVVVIGLLVAGIVALRAEAQVHLLLAIDRLEELVAKRAVGKAPEDARRTSAEE